ncbi:MAG: response regulator transcription factor [Gemmatimonadota bacterium]|nr:MAG: response regulator transcription factor [Gemmatimonadota bacterium]
MTGNAGAGAPGHPARVLLVDDHPIVRQGLEQLIDAEQDLTVCAQASDAPTALAAVEQERPDLAVVDISLAGSDGLELVKQIRERWPAVKVMVLSMHSESVYAERTLSAGAQGYIMKQEPPDRILHAMREVLQGNVFLSDALRAKLLQRLVGVTAGRERTPIERLTDRELTVLRLIGAGRGTRKIAQELGLSVKTIETYRENLKRKLHLDSAAELVQYAVRWLQQESGG